MKLKGKKVAILVEDLYDEFEFWYPKMRLEEEGAEVVVLAPRKGEFKGKKGFPAKADAAVSEADASSFDGVLIPGGYCPDRLRRYREVLDFVHSIHSRGGLVATICHGPWVLISAGIVKGRKMTGFFAIKDDIVNAGAQYLDQSVVRDGNLITSRQPSDLYDYMREIISFLGGHR